MPFGAGEVMLERVVRLVNKVVPAERIVCAAALGQKLPQLPPAVRIVVDPVPGRGPLAGLAAGMAELSDRADAAYVTGCDTPLLKPAFIERMFELLDDYDIAAPHDGGRWHPLAGVYRTGVLPRIDELLSAGERSLAALLEACRTRRVPLEDLRDVDPELASLATCNTLEEYQGALRAGGLTSSQ